MNLKLILCLQYHEADKATAMRLARIIADIEPEMRHDIEFCFVRRFDCEPDVDTMLYVAGKFRVSAFKTHTKWTGWPAGPNAMARDLLVESLRRTKTDESWRMAGGLLLLEPDCMPLSRNWLNELSAAWEKTGADKWLMGAWRPSGGEFGHINGVCVTRTDLGAFVDLSVINEHLAWDCALSPQVHQRWEKTELIRNLFQQRNVSEAELLNTHGDAMPVLAHGIKDDSALEIARRFIL